MPGVSISRYSPVGAYGGAQGGSVYIRGAGTARPGGEVRIYSDGVPRESGVWSHPLMDIVPIDFAERITVAKNPQPQHYAGTFGAVDVETRRRQTEGHEANCRRLRPFQHADRSAAAGGVTDLFDYYAGAAYKYSEGARKHGEAELRSAPARPDGISPHDHLSYIFLGTDNWVRDPARKAVRGRNATSSTPRPDPRGSPRNSNATASAVLLLYYEDGESAGARTICPTAS